jgi:hypothetical protein
VKSWLLPLFIVSIASGSPEAWAGSEWICFTHFQRQPEKVYPSNGEDRTRGHALDATGIAAISIRDQKFVMVNLRSGTETTTSIAVDGPTGKRHHWEFSSEPSVLITKTAIDSPSDAAASLELYEFWNTSTGKKLHESRVPERSVGFHFDGKQLLIRELDKLELVDLSGGDWRIEQTLHLPHLPDGEARYLPQERKIVFVPLFNSTLYDNLPLPVEISLDRALVPIDFQAFSDPLLTPGLRSPLEAPTFKSLNAKLRTLFNRGVDSVDGYADNNEAGPSEAFEQKLKRINAMGMKLTQKWVVVYGTAAPEHGSETASPRPYIRLYDRRTGKMFKNFTYPGESATRITHLSVFNDRFLAIGEESRGSNRDVTLKLFPIQGMDLEQPLAQIAIASNKDELPRSLSGLTFNQNGEVIYLFEKDVWVWKPLDPFHLN